ncbi:MAG: DUF58 domain-containing protein [Verrucomicrobiota bacterium]
MERQRLSSRPVDASLFDSAFLSKLEQLYLLSRKVFRGEQHAERRSRQTGSSMEFADYRNYTSGDDLRTVDWNVFGRLNRLFVKLFEAEQDLHVSILLDCSASMRWTSDRAPEGALSKFDHARRLAAALAYVALANQDRVNLFPFGTGLGADLGFVRGKQQFHAVLDFLKRVPLSGGPTLMLPCFRSFSRKLKRRGLALVLTDLFDPEAADALTFLRQQQFEVVALQVLDPADLDPALAGAVGEDLRLVEAESGVEFDVLADGRLLEGYRTAMAEFVGDVEANCRKRGIGFIQTTTEVPFEELVMRVMRERRIVK